MTFTVNRPPYSGANTDGAMLPWILRLGVAACYIGHGAFGVITKAAWVPYFGVAGIGETAAWKLMPWVGTMDIAIGILALLWPCRCLLAWAVAWAVWTALLRPLSGEPFWEALERAGNYGVPLAILAVVGLRGSWLARLPDRWTGIDAAAGRRLFRALQFATATLLVGHAGLGLVARKAGLAVHYAAIGFGDGTDLVPVVGVVEFILAALVLAVPRTGLLLGVCLWKIVTESLFLVSGAPVWELVERAGSYAAPLALAVLLSMQSRRHDPLPFHRLSATPT